MLSVAERRRRREQLVAPHSRRQGGVVTRRQLYALGISRYEVRAQVMAGRWWRVGGQCIRVSPPDHSTAHWEAVLEVGPAAVVDGISALLAAGLRTVTADQIHVAVPPGHGSAGAAVSGFT